MVYLLTAVFIFGSVFGAREFDLDIEIVSLFAVAIGIVCAYISLISLRYKVFAFRLVLGLLVGLPLFLFGYVLSLRSWDAVYSARDGLGNTPQQINWEGVLISDVNEGGSKDSAVIMIHKMGSDADQMASDFSKRKALIRLPPYSGVGVGDVVRFRARPEIPEDFLTDSGLIFPYSGYLAAKGVAFIVKPSSVEVVSVGSGLSRSLYTFRRRFEWAVHQSMSEMSANLVCGVLLGTKKGLTGIEPVFRRAGLTHILVLSGFNVTIVAVFIAACLGFLGRRNKFIVSLAAILIFGLMVGMAPTVLRSVLMAILALTAGYIYRPYGVGRALAFSAVIMVGLNPLVAAFDPSFQLSFISTIGLVVFSGHFKNWLVFLPERFGIRELIASTLAVLTFSTPFILMTMGQVSFVAIISNILVTPVIPVLMLFGFAAAIPQLLPFGEIAMAAGQIIGLFADIIARYVLYAGATIGTWKIASTTFVLGIFPTALIYVSYTALIYAAALKRASATSQFIFAKKSST